MSLPFSCCNMLWRMFGCDALCRHWFRITVRLAPDSLHWAKRCQGSFLRVWRWRTTDYFSGCRQGSKLELGWMRSGSLSSSVPGPPLDSLFRSSFPTTASCNRPFGDRQSQFASDVGHTESQRQLHPPNFIKSIFGNFILNHLLQFLICNLRKRCWCPRITTPVQQRLTIRY